MLPSDINSLSIQDLCDLLSKKTMELLELTEQKGIHTISIIRSKEFEVKLIQSAITNKRSQDEYIA
jgi:hypothetical protein